MRDFLDNVVTPRCSMAPMTVSVRDLQIGEMISISAAWTGANKAVFTSIPQIAPLYDRMEASHNGLVGARDGASSTAVVADLVQKADRLDERHDDLNRGLYYLLLAAKHFEMGRDNGDPAFIEAVSRASDKLFPRGLLGILASYQAEAGNAAQLNALATNEYGALLSDIFIHKTVTALDMAHAIGTVGAELGAVEQQRIAAAADVKNETITPSEVRRRMREWAQVAEAVLVNLELAAGSPEAIETIRRPLLETAEKAQERRRQKRTKPAPTP